YNDLALIALLRALKRHFPGRHMILVWDGLRGHKSRAMRKYLAGARAWLTVEPLPGYAPELNPVEQIWGNIKGRELANLPSNNSPLGSCSTPDVFVMEATDARQLHHPSLVRPLHSPMLGCVFSQGQVCPGPVVVVNVLRQDPAKMPFANHDDVVKAFPSNRANHPLGIRVLPRRAGRDDRLPDVQRLGLTRKSLSIDFVSVPNEIPGPLLQRARLEQLARRPFRS